MGSVLQNASALIVLPVNWFAKAAMLAIIGMIFFSPLRNASPATVNINALPTADQPAPALNPAIVASPHPALSTSSATSADRPAMLRDSAALNTSPNQALLAPSAASHDPTVSATKSRQDLPLLHDYQTIIVGVFTFTIGIFTAINAFVNTFIAKRSREKEEKLKRLAFLTIMERDITHISEQLLTAKEIISTVDAVERRGEIQRATGWIASVRIAPELHMRIVDQATD